MEKRSSTWLHEVRKRAASLAGTSDLRPWGKHESFMEEAEEELGKESVFTQSHLGTAMHEYLSMSIESIITCENHIIRAIGMLDRRFGKRRLEKTDVTSEHPLVKTMFLFRAQAEGIMSSE